MDGGGGDSRCEHCQKPPHLSAAVGLLLGHALILSQASQCPPLSTHSVFTAPTVQPLFSPQLVGFPESKGAPRKGGPVPPINDKAGFQASP